MSADPLTHAELDAHIRSLTSVGGIYAPLAEVIEHYNRPHCVGKEDEDAERSTAVDDIPDRHSPTPEGAAT